MAEKNNGVLIICVLIFLSHCILISAQSSFNIRYHLNTKTVYWTQQDSTTYTVPPEGCQAEPVQLNFLSRHGARFPTSGDINKFDALSEVMHENAQYFAPQYSWMATWEDPFKLENAGLLTYLGQVELYNSAQRLMKLLNPLLNEKYYPYVYPMQSTQVSRTGQSGTSFGFSFLQNNGHLPPYTQSSFQPFFIYSDSENEDFQLRFFDNCPYYTDNILDNDNATIQATLFEEEYVVPLAHEISIKLGVYPHWNISASQEMNNQESITTEVNSLYSLCSFDISMFNITDHFCAIFDEDESAILEYYNDLGDYYKKGYGHPINYEISCPLLKDFFNISDSFINGDEATKAKLRFAHAETHMPIISLLGFYKDPSPLMANWTWEQINNRQWRTSVISPYAATVQSILYKCSNTPSGYMLRFLVNEKEMIAPGCNTVYCDYQTVKNTLSEAISCPFVDLCYPNADYCNLSCDEPVFPRRHRRSVLDDV